MASATPGPKNVNALTPLGNAVDVPLPWLVGVLALAAACVALAVFALRRSRRPRAAGPWGRDDAALGTLWSHLADLRRALLVSGLCLAVATTLCLTFRLGWWHGLPVPVPDAYDNVAAQLFRHIVADLVPPDVPLLTTSPTDAFAADFDIALGLGVTLSLPVILAQLGGFFAPALRPKERRLLLRLLLPALALFLVGAAFAYWVVMPTALSALYTYADVLIGDRGQPMLAVGEFVRFTVGFMLVTGATFLTPLVMYALARVGLVGPRSYLRMWRGATVFIVILAAWITPDPTILSQVMVAGPLLGLYFVGVGLSVVGKRRHERSAAA